MPDEENKGIQQNEDHVSQSLGMRIRQIRNEKDLTIVELSKLTGLTPSLISQVERAIISPSIATLKKIGNAMGIPLSYLFESVHPEETEQGVNPAVSVQMDAGFDMEAYLRNFIGVINTGHSPVVHKEQRKVLSPGHGIRLYLLNPNLSGPIEFIYNEYDPGSTTGPGLYSHPGSECGLILSGELIVRINDEVHVLKEGDSITFNSTQPHLIRNDSDKMCTGIWANVPPWF